MNMTRQGALFLLVGGVLVLVDTGIFVLFSAAGLPPVEANVLGRVAGALVGFWLNGTITFRVAAQSLLRSTRILKFWVLWCTLTVISSITVGILASHLGLQSAWMAKPIVEGSLAVVSFICSRHWVYR